MAEDVCVFNDHRADAALGSLSVERTEGLGNGKNVIFRRVR